MKSLPVGSTIEWAPSDVREGNEPIINLESEMKLFKKFCSDHGIILVIIPGG